MDARVRTVLNQLLPDLEDFLIVLDDENLSSSAQTRKRSILDLLTKLQDPPEETEYMVMNGPAGESNSSPQVQGPPNTGDLLHAVVQLSPDAEELFSSSCTTEWPQEGSPNAAELSQAAVNSDGGHHEGVDPAVSVIQISVESQSSLYEPYGNGQGKERSVKDHAHYLEWTSSQHCLRVAHLRLLVEEALAGPVGQAAAHRPPAPPAALPASLGPLANVGAESGGLPGVVQIRSQPASFVPAEGCECLTDSGAGLPELAAGAGVEMIEAVSSSDHSERTSLCSWSLLDSDWLDSRRSSTGSPTVSIEHQPSSAPPSRRQSREEQGFLNVLMHCQWQSLWCQLQGAVLHMFRDQGSKMGPQYCLLLQGCRVQADQDGSAKYRIAVTQSGDQVAVLEASTEEEGQRWLRLLQERSVRTSDMYSDGPFHTGCGTTRDRSIHCNISQNSKNATTGDTPSPEDAGLAFHGAAGIARGMVADLHTRSRRWGLTGLKQRSEVDLLKDKRQSRSTPFRHTVALCTDQAQRAWLNLLRWTTSTKNSLKRAPSTLQG